MGFQAYIDESGGKGQGGVFVFAGLIGEADDWARFATDWRAYLGEVPAVPYLSMRDAAKLSGAFHRWSRKARDEKLLGLTRTIGRFPLTAYYCVMDVRALSRTLGAEDRGKLAASPYWQAFHFTVMGLYYDLHARGVAEQFDLVFDEHMIFGPDVKQWYPLVKHVVEQVTEPDAPKILPPAPSFADDKKVMPLQAADMLAWLFRRAWNGERSELEWIAEELQKTIPMSSHSQIVDEERLKRIRDESDAKRFTRDEFARYSALIGPGAPRGRRRKRQRYWG